MKTILTINCGDRAEACAQGLACAIFNASEMEILDPLVRARYQGSNVNIVVDDEDLEKANPNQIFSALSKAMGFVIKASKEGFDGSSPEEMLDVFSYPDEGTAFYSNVNDKVDLTVADLEFLQKELTSAIDSEKLDENINNKKEVFHNMNKEQALKIISEAGMKVVPSSKIEVNSDNLEEFYEDLNASLSKIGYDAEDYEEFEEELNDMGLAHLFNVASDDEYEEWEEDHGSSEGYSDHYFAIAEKYIRKLKRDLSRKWTGFDISADQDDTMIFVELYVDSMGDEE